MSHPQTQEPSDTPSGDAPVESASEAKKPETKLSKLAHIMDNAFRIPGTKFRIGLDPIIGLLFQGFGDAFTAVAGTTIVWEALKKGVPKRVVLRMAFNVLINSVLGAMPVIGDLFSACFKSNAQNHSLLVKYTIDPGGEIVKPRWWPILALLTLNILAIAAVWYAIGWLGYSIYNNYVAPTPGG